ncbi:ABC transporter substrate-binding protein [Nocardia brasiliensis]|nr:ABC transporter substrate-binding protein [Nocardia brasiliensis]AVL26438.1 ABC transporter substrate-binding protein [Nocardia brasiliensis]SUB11440.1 Putative ABC transporter substrate-binding lipoprotein yhfQ precursor [Nocardia brasiliensis]
MKLGRRTAGRGRGMVGRAVAVLAVGLLLTSAACGSDDKSDDASGAVTITHSLGETAVSGTPKRIVTLGNQWLDATLALGVTPVGYADNVSMGSKSKVPWVPDSLNEAKVLSMGSDVVEQIAALEPDLILVPGFMVDKAMYEKLSKLAPTIGPVTPNAQVDQWSDQLATLGKVLHRQADADKVVADVNARIDGVAHRYPGLRGKTFLTCMLTGSAQLMVLADPKDGSATLFNRLGMSIPEKIAQEAPAGGRLALSPERLGDLTSDMLVCGALPAFEEKFKRLPGYDALPSVQRNGIAFVDVTTISAINTPTPLSVPFVLDKLDPTFAAVSK